MEWYISNDFIPSETEKIISLCKMLKSTQDIVLCGVNYSGNCPITQTDCEKIDRYFEIYQNEPQTIEKNTETAIGKLIAEKTGLSEKSISRVVKEDFEKFSSEQRWTIKMISAVLQYYGENFRNKVLKPQNIVFSCMPDVRFSSENEISTKFDKNNLFFWYRIEPEDIKQFQVLYPDTLFLITPEGADFYQYRYLIEIVEYSRYSLALRGEKHSIEQYMKDDFGGLFGDERQFTCFVPELKKYM